MLLKSVSLENIRSYTRQTVLFPEGSILLSGDIGSGKTTILLAVEFAIFGARRGELSAASLLRHGAAQGSVELHLILEGKEIAVKRVLKKGKNGIAQDAGSIVIDGVKTEMTPIELKAKVLELIGYPDELVTKSKSFIFRYTVYTPQEEMKSILFEDAEERLVTLRKIFGIDKYQRIQENAQMYLRHVRQQQKILAAKLEDLPGLEQRHAKVKQEKDFLTLEKDKALAALKSIQQEYDSCKEKKAKMEQQVQHMTIVKQELSYTELSLKEKKERFETNRARREGLLQEIARIMAALQRFPKDLPLPEEMRTNIARLEQQIGDVQASLAAVTQEIIVKEKELLLLTSLKLDQQRSRYLEGKERFEEELAKNAILERQLAEADANIDHVKAKLQNFELQIRSAQSTRQKISALEKCPLCLQNVDHAHKQHIMDEQDATVKVFLPQKESMEKVLAQHLQRKADLAQRQQAFQKMRSEAARAEAELTGVDEKLAHLQQLAIGILTLKQRRDALAREPVAAWTEKKKEFQELLATLANHQEIVRQEKLFKGQLRTLDEEQAVLGNGIAELVGRISFLSKRASELDVLKEYDLLRAQEIDLEQQLRDIMVFSTQKDKEYGFAELQLKEIEQALVEKKAMLSTLHQYHGLEHWLSESFINLAQTIERQLFLQIHQEFSDVFSTWFGLLMEEENFTVRIDESFTPIIEQNGYETEVGHLSGGEKTAVALAYRLALNRVINDVMGTIKTRDLLILDEPTDGFSSEQLDKMRDVLTLLKVKQLILVSHESKMETLVHHIIRINKEHHQSSVTAL